MQRIARSFRLLRESLRVLRRDKELVLMPFLGGVASLLLAAGFLLPLFLAGRGHPGERLSPWWAAGLLVFYFAVYALGLFFQAAVVAGALERFAGGDPSVGSALRAAWRRRGALLAWALVAATVGVLLRSLERRSEALGRLVAAFLGAAWSLATFFVVPVLVMERLSLRASCRRSWALCRQAWGEAVSGRVGLGLAGFLLGLAVAGVCAGLAALGWTAAALAVGLVAGGALGLTLGTLQGIYVAALYRYATTGRVEGDFDEGTLGGALAG